MGLLQALELLDPCFADGVVRSFAVGCVEALDDEALPLLQLVQALKHEATPLSVFYQELFHALIHRR